MQAVGINSNATRYDGCRPSQRDTTQIILEVCSWMPLTINIPSTSYEPPCNLDHVPLGSRIKETHDFGFITLDIMSVIPEDAGMYMCKAINKAGDDVTTASLRVHG